ncbi:MAG: aromatic amino acid lyase, partial [Paludibacteraceae bacterium]|nr:aromatic amino acid lyase [Paludibacteraceae bacterium]
MGKIDYISLNDIENILYKGEQLSFASNVWDRINRSHDFLKSFSVDRIIYGINTGFGPMAQWRISDEDRE